MGFSNLDRKTFFLCFGGRRDFSVIAGKCVFQFWRENGICCFGGKMNFYWFCRENASFLFWWAKTIFHFGGKTGLPVLTGKHNFPVLAEKKFFCWENEISCLAGNHYFWFWHKNEFFFLVLTENKDFWFLGEKKIFGCCGKTNVLVLAENRDFSVLAIKTPLSVLAEKRFSMILAKNTFCDFVIFHGLLGLGL